MGDLIPLETIGAKRPVKEALAKMCANKFSQLPVIQNNICIGSVTFESILCQLRAEDLRGNSALDFMNWPVERFVVTNPRFVEPDDDILKHVEWMAEKGYVIVGSPYEYKSIFTNYDLVHFFKNQTEVFLLLRETEITLRFIVSCYLQGKRLKKALASLRKEHGPPPYSIDDLTFDELRQLINRNWREFKDPFLDQQKIDNQLQKIRDLRNRTFHHRTRITRQELASLKKLRDNYLRLANSLAKRKPL